MTKQDSIDALLGIASAPLGPAEAVSSAALLEASDGMRAVMSVLRRRNGFYAFESALLFRPLSSCGSVRGIIEWNSPAGWRAAYGDAARGITFFAEDIFAVQFGITASGVVSFNPETAEIIELTKTLNEWVGAVLSDYAELTGWPLAREWQATHGPIPPGKRLLPRKPFVLGGEYEVENLVAVDEQEAITKLGRLYAQIARLPDGQSVTLSDWL